MRGADGDAGGTRDAEDSDPNMRSTSMTKPMPVFGVKGSRSTDRVASVRAATR